MIIREGGVVCAIVLLASVTVTTEEPAVPVVKGLVKFTLAVLYGVMSRITPPYSA